MRTMMPDVLETLEESYSPTTYNSRHHDAHYLYFKGSSLNAAHVMDPKIGARHCVVPADVSCNRPSETEERNCHHGK